jgi:hypothetical protein
MKRLFSSPDLVAVTHLKDLLDDASIACFIKNEVAAQLFGDIPKSEAVPELWIDDDSRLAEAMEIKKDYLGPQSVHGSSWTCPKCGEKIEPQFTSCWKCGTARPSVKG